MTKTFTAHTGVVLELRMVGAWLVHQATRSIKAPVVPKQFIDDKGREEDNPAHPDYVAALEEYNVRLANLVMDTYIHLGTAMLEKPDGLPGPTENGWIEELAVVGITVREGPLRYADWVKFTALRGDTDEMAALREAIANVNAVTEEAVSEAADSFRGAEERSANLGAPALEGRPNGNRAQRRAARLG